MSAADIRLTIKRGILSQNHFNNKRGMGAKFAYSADRDDWMVWLRTGLTPKARVQQHTRIRIESYRARLLDDANLRGGAKPIPDCLIRLGYLWDDHPKWMHADYFQLAVKPEHRRTVVIIFAHP